MKKKFLVAIISSLMAGVAFAQDQTKPVVKAAQATATKKAEQAKGVAQDAAKPTVKAAEAKVKKVKTDAQKALKKVKLKKHHKGQKAAGKK